MTFTPQQLSVLSQWESNFRCMLQANYSRGIGSTGYHTVHQILVDATGDKTRYCFTCSGSLSTLMRKVATLYFKDVEELKQKEQSHIVETKPKKVRTRKATVKTTKTE